jgi:hypothetical protein
LEDGDGVLVMTMWDSVVTELLIAEAMVVGLKMLERLPDAEAVMMGRVALAVAREVGAEEVQVPTSSEVEVQLSGSWVQ